MDISNPFGFVAGRWAFATADTAGDPDRGPDYVPASGASITFTPETPRQVVPDTPGWTGVINKRVVGKLNEEGRLVDAEGHNHLALGVGTYAVHYYFGNGIKWPSHRIQVTEAHTASNPLWLPPMPAPPPVPDAVNRTIQVPADGTDGQVLVWDGGAFSWDYPPTGPQGPKGDLDAEQLAGAPRLTNKAHDITWYTNDATIDSQTDRTVAFTAAAQDGRIRGGTYMYAGSVYYASVGVKTTSGQVFFGAGGAPQYHSGSGDWEWLTSRVAPAVTTGIQVRDGRESGWDQVEARDAVMINLTAVFGAGREPTKEYMDALLAKHGHYIGGVDQFAVGDALQALTVAGPGMTLRHDNSVGERVFLDHPGGSTMLYGDTGWRNIDDLANIGEAVPGQPTKIRRINDQIYFTYRRDAVTIGSGSTIFTLPSGWYTGQSQERRYPSGAYGNSHAQFRIAGVPSGLFGTMQPMQSGIENAVLYLEDSWATTIPWPTTLPGTPL